MTGWLKLNDEQRKATIDQAEQLSGISAKAIEKDWWVTLTLKALFQSAYAQYMIFKGGTSLSKCWKLIDRFSEDIDIALAPEVFGMQYIKNPGKSAVERLKRRGCAFTTNELRAELERQFETLGLPAGLVNITAAPVRETFPDTDPQTLYVKYRSLYEPSSYLVDEVKIEVSVRSLQLPYAAASVQSILNETNPNAVYEETPFTIAAVVPQKTFLEKILLLHEEFCKPDISKVRTERMSRHLYDLGNIMKTDYGHQAIADHKLYESLVQHRQWYSRISWVDYNSMNRATISFIPPPAVLDIYRQDYTLMQEQMIYGAGLPFDDLMEQLMLLQEALRNVPETKLKI